MADWNASLEFKFLVFYASVWYYISADRNSYSARPCVVLSIHIITGTGVALSALWLGCGLAHREFVFRYLAGTSKLFLSTAFRPFLGSVKPHIQGIPGTSPLLNRMVRNAYNLHIRQKSRMHWTYRFRPSYAVTACAGNLYFCQLVTDSFHPWHIWSQSYEAISDTQHLPCLRLSEHPHTRSCEELKH